MRRLSWTGHHPALKCAGIAGLLAFSLFGVGVISPAEAIAEPLPEGAVTTSVVEQSISLTTRQFRFADNGDLDVTSLTWESSDEDVATVNEEGLVIAVAPGEAIVTATDASGVTVSTTTVSVAESAYSEDYDLMQDRWLRRIVGAAPSDGALDMSDEELVSYAQAQIVDAESNWAALDELRDEDGNATCWPKIESDSPSANYTSQLRKLRPLVIAFGMNLEGNEFYQSRALYEDIMSVLDYFVSPDGMNYGTEDWQSYCTDTVVSNWWDWQIGCPGRLADMLIVMSDYCDYAQIEPVVDAMGTYCQEPEKQLNAASGWVTSTGSNRTDIANAMMGMAIVSHTPDNLVLVDEQVPTVLAEVTSGDGIYADGSIVQHTAQAYTGSYGNELIKGVAKITAILADTEWEFDDPAIYNLYNAVLTGYIPLMHGSEMMSMVCGRAAARVQDTSPYSVEKYWGNETIANLLNIAQSAPESYKEQFLSAIKGWLLDAGSFYYENARDFDALLLARSLMADDSITASTFTGMSVFGSMDRVVQQTGSYAAGLSMYSSRIYNYECMNNENKHGWHTGDGMLYIYNDDEGAYDIGFWPTVDPYRLPGTTVDTRELEDGAATASLSEQDWVGGVTDGINGAAGMAYDASNLGLDMDLTAKKSNFFLDGKIVELGAGITGTTDATIETTVENRIMTNGDASIMVNGEAWSGEKNVELADGDYVTMAGPTDSTGMGYYFIEGAPVEMSKETRTGTYAEINDSFPYDEEFTRSYFKLGINHGGAVDDETYAFIVMPGDTSSTIDAYAQNPSIKVLANDENVQAVYDESAGIIAANVWSEDGATVAGITVNGPASIYAVEHDGTLDVYVSDPTHLSTELTVRVDGVEGTESLGDTVTDNLDGAYTVSVAGTAGATQSFSVRVSQDGPTVPDGPSTPDDPSDSVNPDDSDADGPDDSAKPSGDKNEGSDGGEIPAAGDVLSSVAPVAATGLSALAAALVVRRTRKHE